MAAHRGREMGRVLVLVLFTVLLQQQANGEDITTGMNHHMHPTESMADHMDHTADTATHHMHGHDMDATTVPHDHHHDMDHSDMDHNDTDHNDMDHNDHNDMDHNDHNNNDNNDHDDMDHNMGHSSGHGAYFVISNESVILLRKWVTDDDKSIGLACLYVVLFAMAYEGLKVFRDHIYSVEKGHKTRKSQGKYALNGDDPAGGIICSPQLILLHLFQTILHIIQVFMSLILMLVFMTFNVYLCIAVVGGAGVGYLFIGWKKSSSDSDEHCN